MRETNCLGLGAALAAVAMLAGCPAADDSGETGASMTNVTMSSTMTMSATDTSDTEPTTTEAESSSGMPECPDDSLSFATDIQPIFDEHCVTDCHITGGNWAQLILVDPAYDTIFDEESLETQTVDELVLIAPFDLDNSYIVHKINGTHGDVVDPVLAQLRMPSMEEMCMPGVDGCPMTGIRIVEGPPLPDNLIQTIEDWVICGAPE